MALELYVKFKEVFRMVSASDLAKEVYREGVRPYVDNNYDTLDSSFLRYSTFYKTVEEDTGISPKTNLYDDFDHEAFNTRFSQGTVDKKFSFAVYYWFHAFKLDFPEYADSVDKAVVKKNPQIEKSLHSIRDIIQHEFSQEVPPHVGQSEHEKKSPLARPGGLTPQQKEEIFQQLVDIIENPMLSMRFSAAQAGSDSAAIIAELECDEEYRYLECDGLGFDYEIALTTVEIESKAIDVELERANYEPVGPGAMEQCKYKLSLRQLPGFDGGWRIRLKARTKEDYLNDNLLRGYESALLYASPRPEKGMGIIEWEHKLHSAHVKIQTISRPDWADERKNLSNLIQEVLLNEIVRLNNDQRQELQIQFRQEQAPRA